MRINLEELEKVWKTTSLKVHPDRFATARDAEKRIAMQWTTQLNLAYQTLSNPLQRAVYLCQLQGINVNAEDNTAMSGAFLMQQMELRESLDDLRQAQDKQGMELMRANIQAQEQAYEQEITHLIDHEKAYAQASSKIREWMFIQKINQSIHI